MSQLDSKLIFEQTRSRLGGLVQTRESGLSCANLVEKKIPRNGVVFAVTGLGICFPSCLLMHFFFLPQNLALSHSHPHPIGELEEFLRALELKDNLVLLEATTRDSR